jgi:hypothetical protein
MRMSNCGQVDSRADRERIQACLDQFARFVVTKATDAVLGHVDGTGQKVQ